MDELELYKKRLERAERRVELLEEAIEEKIRELYLRSETELKKRNEELEQKYYEMEHFAYIASHDLQEPLRTMHSLTEFLHFDYADKLDERGVIYIREIQQSAERMTQLIQDLLAHGKIGNNNPLEVIDLNKLLGNVRKGLSQLLQETKTTINIPDLPGIKGYRTELGLLFQNLISNAIKFKHPNRDAVIDIEGFEHQDYYLFAVKDNGIGIPEEHQDKIFQLFRRLHSKEEFHGNGIGLSHCLKIVHLHEGKIWVESDGSSGSSFYFRLSKL